MSSRTHVRDLIQNRLGGDASLPLSMTDTWQEILPPYGRQNDSFRERLPYVIPNEHEESPAICLRFFTTLTLRSE
ncbi:MAG: hypothetical protein HPZ82_06830 [Coprobacter sp.]|nr:hypothetical protein [Coprobacter sp.]